MKRLITASIAALAAAGCGSGASGGANSIKIKGSDTELNLVQAMAEAYMKQYPNITISVLGGGSGTGIAALINHEVDIANSSRPIKENERAKVEAKAGGLTEFIFGRDAISIITNPENPIEDISSEDLARVFRGEVKNWSEIGGPDLPISLYGRQSNSGTFVFFREHLVQGDYSPDLKPMNGNAQIVEGVKTDKAGIGYVGLGYVMKGNEFIPGVRVLKVDGKAPGEPGYPISRPLYQYIAGKPTGPVKDFLGFELSDQGQEIVKKVGFLPIKGTQDEAKARKLLEE